MADHELVEERLDLLRGRGRREGRRAGRLLLVARHHVVRVLHAVDADVAVRPGDDRHLTGGSTAERTDILLVFQTADLMFWRNVKV